MLERAGETAFDHDMHHGALPMRVQWYFLDRSRLPVAVQLWELPPGGSEGMHAHPDDEPLEELYLVIEGSARMRVDEEEHDLGPGDAVLAPVGAEHDLRNTGSRPLKVLVVWGRPSAEPVDWSPFGTARGSRAARAAAEGGAPTATSEHGRPGHGGAVLDLRAFRVARHGDSVDDLLTVVTGADLGSALQQVGDGLLARYLGASPGDRERLRPAVLAVAAQLDGRDWEGDDLLAEDLRAAADGTEPPGRMVPVDLDELTSAPHGGELGDDGCYLNVVTGDVVPSFLTDPMEVGEDQAVDVEGDDSWLWLGDLGDTEWRDMEAFSLQLPDERHRARLLDAIEGKGAFSRFRRIIGDLDLVPQWLSYRDDRRWGRAREALAVHGIHPWGSVRFPPGQDLRST
ncbi:MAG TPA: cupin domain-containing protein [Segeticoccus sp.]|uniref:cupin domain-containing protein n=1 Tax=Segeticoccus sp. TaxID=2706531 RepID=UPI002D801838|nr:cupin domain-containing protein [Segeticoccus sp.]HET8600893.1 cupin domain-containing protein [Segeticoccus sp.]